MLKCLSKENAIFIRSRRMSAKETQSVKEIDWSANFRMTASAARRLDTIIVRSSRNEDHALTAVS